MLPAVKPADRLYFGKAVENGKIRFLSVSQVQAYDPTQEGGCPRRWAFRYIWGKKEPTTIALALGTQCAQEGEQYLKTGQDVLSSIMRAGKHLLPKPGPDLEVEKPLGDIALAVKIREELIRCKDQVQAQALIRNLKQVAGLTANNIPFMGAADFRHRRGEYIDSYGRLLRELEGYTVAEVGDHKTSSRIDDHVSASGKIYPGYAKTVEQILNNIQMVGYGVNTADQFPDLTHIRLSHIYYQTKNGYTAAKRTGLISVEEVRNRWRRVEAVAAEMEISATALRPEDVPVNTKSCRAYNKDCIHMPYCERPPESKSMSALFDSTTRKGEPSMSTGLFDSTPNTSNGVVAYAPPTSSVSSEPDVAGLFGGGGTAPAPALPPKPVMGDAERAAAIAAAKALLLAEEGGTVVPVAPVAIPVIAAPVSTAPASTTATITAFGFCSACGTPTNSANASRTPNGAILHIGCPAMAAAPAVAAIPAPAPAPAVAAPALPTIPSLPPLPGVAPHIAAINPVDAPAPDFVASAAPLTAQTIAEITDPALRLKAEEHARAHAARIAEIAAASPDTGKKEKAGGRCGAAGQKISVTMAELVAKKKKWKCPSCDKEMSLSPMQEGEQLVVVVKPHNMQTKETVEAAAAAETAGPSIPASPTATVLHMPTQAAVPAIPALPVAAAPALPPSSAGSALTNIFITDVNGVRRALTQDELDATCRGEGSPIAPVSPLPAGAVPALPVAAPALPVAVQAAPAIAAATTPQSVQVHLTLNMATPEVAHMVMTWLTPFITNAAK